MCVGQSRAFAHRMKPVATLINSLLALACSGAVAVLATHHPLSPLLALAACAAVAALVFIRLAWWPLAVLGLLPLAGLMPWTGWITVEEFDLVVLSAAAGGYARLVVSAELRPPMRDFWRVVLLCLPFITSTLISLHIGVADAGGLTWGWWQGYVEPLNALRLAKPLFEVLLLLPLWLAARDADQAHAELMLERGMLCLLAGVVAGVLWERVSFTGLLNFSADYRASGPFWEMHVGGAALDAALVMAIPFAAVALTQARQPLRWLVLGAVCAGALYAALVTFSRIVYAAVPASLLLGLWLRSRAGGPGNTARWSLRLWAAGALALLVFAAVAAWAFGSGGYRGLFMAWSIAALTGLVWRLPFAPAQWPWLLTLGALLLAWAVVVASVLPAQRPTLIGFLPLLLVAAPVITLAALGRLTPLWSSMRPNKPWWA